MAGITAGITADITAGIMTMNTMITIIIVVNDMIMFIENLMMCLLSGLHPPRKPGMPLFVPIAGKRTMRIISFVPIAATIFNRNRQPALIAMRLYRKMQPFVRIVD